MTLLTGFGHEEMFIQRLLQKFEARIEQAESFALRNRVLLLKSRSNIGIDIAFGGLDFEILVIERSSMYEFLPEVSLRTCSAEDLVIYKAFADRPRDWGDIESILLRQRQQLAWEYILHQLTPLIMLKEQPNILKKLEGVRAKYA